MHARRVRFFALAWATILLGSCDKNAVGPEVDDPSFSANPGDPTNLRAEARSHREIYLEWADNSSRETGFELYRSTAGGQFSFLRSTDPDVIAAIDGGLAPATQYCYQVRSYRILGKTRYSAFSEPACATTPSPPPLPAPSALNATPVGSTAVQVSWTNNSTSATHFRVERSTDGGATWVNAGSANYTVFTDVGRTSDQEVCYRAIAINSYGDFADSPPSNTDCTAPPSRPTNLTATTLPGLAIRLTWTGSSVADEYQVWRRFLYCYPDYYGYQWCYEYYDVIGRSTEAIFDDTNLLPGEYHYYYVVALNDGGYSDQSDIVSAWSDPPPAAPLSLTATAASQTQIDLAWIDASSDEVNFAIQRCTGDIAACSRDENFAGLDQAADANATTFSDTSVEPGKTYTYRILSCHSHCSDPSDKASATTPP